ncbi:MAG: hypothetical protein QOJ50_3103 [Cryptosporangiaceae bacterium]|jgi:hypothetical protein|nr:hypothetical protein [Cryptosporangiaceae bacterium]
MNTVNGLPAHVLLVHGVVVLLPMASFLLVLTAVWPPARARFAGPNAILSVAALALVPITTNAGQWLYGRLPHTELLRRHSELGDTALYAAAPVAVLALVVWWRHREAGQTTGPGSARRSFLAPENQAVTWVIVVLAVLVAGSAVYDTYRIGDSGAKATWNGIITSAPAPGGN